MLTHISITTKLRGDIAHNAAYYRGLSHLTIQSNIVGLNLVFDNFSDVGVSNSYLDLVERDTSHPSLAVDLKIFLSSYLQSPRLFRKYSHGDYMLLCTVLSF
jgi:hypothetical protein